jgi:hypothetical protein
MAAMHMERLAARRFRVRALALLELSSHRFLGQLNKSNKKVRSPVTYVMLALALLTYGVCSGCIAASATFVKRFRWVFVPLVWAQILVCLIIAAWALFVKGAEIQTSNSLSFVCFVAGIVGGFLASRAAKHLTSYTLSALAALPILYSFFLTIPMISWDYFLRVPARITLNGEAVAGNVYRRRNEILIVPKSGWRQFLVFDRPAPCEIVDLGSSIAYLGPVALHKSNDLAYGVCSDDVKIDGVPPKLMRTNDSVSFWGASDELVKVYFR